MSEQNKQVSTNEPPPEVSDELVEKYQTEVAEFVSDPRHERYHLCRENKDALTQYLDSHGLDLSRDTLHLAYVELSKEGKLKLYEESKLAPPEPPKEKAKDDLPPIGKAVGDDFGLGLVGQQRFRKTSGVSGVQPFNNRAAFARARERAASQKVPGGRFHL